ncbi:hypothetical protein C8R45DRAFT_1091679 [Mycena sanguinolenta]|nr:hypothetical protein C8R45DRAFT_1091679 [Mycena sanguinolenta]
MTRMIESIWELESAASNGGGISGGTGAELSVAVTKRGRRAPPTPRDRPPPRRPLAQTQEVRADAYGRRPRIRSGAALNEGTRSAPHRARCAHYAGVYPALRPPGALPAALALLAFIPHCAKLAAIALVSCLLSLFATAVATLLAATLLAHPAPGIVHNHLAAVHAPPEPPPLTIPPCPTSLGSVARRWREEQDAPGSHVIEGGTCINCAAAARSGVMPPILYPKLSRMITDQNKNDMKNATPKSIADYVKHVTLVVKWLQDQINSSNKLYLIQGRVDPSKDKPPQAVSLFIWKHLLNT